MRKLLVVLAFYFFPLSALHIDLREPVFSEGILSTDQGGVIEGPNVRIQARNIRLSIKSSEGLDASMLEAEGDIILELGDYVFVGRRLEYDFSCNQGTLYNGRTSLDPWFFGGEEIYLLQDGSFLIRDGFATTSENYKMDWKLETGQTRLKKQRFLSAKDVKFRLFSFPIFWMPSLKLDLDSIFESPFRWTFRTGGNRGARIGFQYEIFSNAHWSNTFELDYRFKNGFGGGFESEYKSPSKDTYFHSINYVARDRPAYNLKEMTRYRLEGNFSTRLDPYTSLDLTWDKLSDWEMATDYDDQDLTLISANPTELEIRRQEPNWILDFLTRFRVNDFQTVLQELPTLGGSYRPVAIPGTGVLAEGRFKASYLEFEYPDDVTEDVHDYNSPRYELYQTFWRPYRLGWLHLTPEAGALAIYYGNNRDKFDRWMTIGLFELEAHTDLFRFYGPYKHVMTPYALYQYYLQPSTPPSDHFIFDITDGWYRLNALRMGIQNNLYYKKEACCIYRKFYFDLFTYAFFDTDTFPQAVPKAYADIVYNVTTSLRISAEIAWDFAQGDLSHYNTLMEWTLSNDLALSAEYRHRNPFDWRKVDYFNFILDSFRTEEELRESALSDQRDTVLLNLFWRFHPNWALGIQSRNGWNRFDEPSYNEYQISLLGTFRSSWQVKISYKHEEDDDRFSINFGVGIKRPDYVKSDCRVPCLEF